MGNGTEMGIVFNKRGGVGMGATRSEPAPLPFLFVYHLSNYHFNCINFF